MRVRRISSGSGSAKNRGSIEAARNNDAGTSLRGTMRGFFEKYRRHRVIRSRVPFSRSRSGRRRFDSFSSSPLERRVGLLAMHCAPVNYVRINAQSYRIQFEALLSGKDCLGGPLVERSQRAKKSGPRDEATIPGRLGPEKAEREACQGIG